MLQQNFRSSFPVLDATNRVFRQTMRPAVTELTYAPEDELICGLGAREDDPPVMVHLLRGPDIRDALEGSASEAAADRDARGGAAHQGAFGNDDAGWKDDFVPRHGDSACANNEFGADSCRCADGRGDSDLLRRRGELF